MAKYTIELRKVIELYGRDEVENWFKDFDLDDFLTKEMQKVIEDAGLWTKDKMAKFLVDNFYFREIGFDTPWNFKLHLKVKLNKIMEYYLRLIYTQSFDYDIFLNVNYTTTRKLNRNTDNTGKANTKLDGSTTATSNGSGLQVNSDTPQGQISKANILNGSYASSTSANEGESRSTSNSNSTSDTNTTGNEKEDLTETFEKKGNDGILATYQNLLLQYRQTIIKINENIANELNDLFMGLW